MKKKQLSNTVIMARLIMCGIAAVICMILFCAREVKADDETLVFAYWNPTNDSTAMTTIDQELALQPQNVRNMLNRLGVTIRAVDNLSIDPKDGACLYARTIHNIDPNTGQLVGSPRIEVNSVCQRETTHEIGHVLSFYNGTPFFWADQPGFQAIYQAEACNYVGITPHCLSNSREFFAFAYDAYIHKPATLKSYCPQTFEYVKNVVALTK